MLSHELPGLVASLQVVLDVVAHGVAVYAPVVEDGQVVDLEGLFLNETGCVIRGTTSADFVGTRMRQRAVELGHPDRPSPSCRSRARECRPRAWCATALPAPNATSR